MGSGGSVGFYRGVLWGSMGMFMGYCGGSLWGSVGIVCGVL